MMKRFFCLSIGLAFTAFCFSQQIPANPNGRKSDSTSKRTTPATPRPSPKPYKEVITDKAVTQFGLFTVHRVEDKWYFEIADSILNREILAITRFVKS
ncbi:MAG TPA: DUF5118 domain-containing protein, partial [Puia sp.]|nr:DUF5118 domain-containing protein [Puia sp.]